MNPDAAFYSGTDPDPKYRSDADLVLLTLKLLG